MQLLTQAALGGSGCVLIRWDSNGRPVSQCSSSQMTTLISPPPVKEVFLKVFYWADRYNISNRAWFNEVTERNIGKCQPHVLETSRSAANRTQCPPGGIREEGWSGGDGGGGWGVTVLSRCCHTWSLPPGDQASTACCRVGSVSPPPSSGHLDSRSPRQSVLFNNLWTTTCTG